MQLNNLTIPVSDSLRQLGQLLIVEPSGQSCPLPRFDGEQLETDSGEHGSAFDHYKIENRPVTSFVYGATDRDVQILIPQEDVQLLDDLRKERLIRGDERTALNPMAPALPEDLVSILEALPIPRSSHSIY